MELNGTQWRNREIGKEEKAFVLEEQDKMCMEVDESVADDEQKMIDRQKKCFPEEKMEAFQAYCVQHRGHIHRFIQLALAAGCVAVVIAACVLNFQRAVGLLVIFSLTVFFLCWDWIMERYGSRWWEQLYRVRDLLDRNWFWIRWVIYVSVLVIFVCWLVVDTVERGPRHVVPFFGMLLLIFIMLLSSKHPFKWSLRTVLGGIGLEFVFGLLILRTTFGLVALEWVGKQAEVFLAFADVGSKFVFGDSFKDHFFAFQVMPILVFLSTVISVLYHIGFMQWLICKIGFLMQIVLGTSPEESAAAAGNIFLGHVETFLLIKPYINGLTLSELHAVMTGGFASISASILGAYINLGIDATHLMTASLMSAPSSLAIAKAFWPETETPAATSGREVKIDKGECDNVIDAASKGATSSIGLVAGIVVNLISFMALLAFFDSILAWLGGMLDCPQLSFALICSYVFMPLSLMMGISWEDSFIVAELIGVKTFLTEFVAYQKLSELIKRRKEGGPAFVNGVKQYLSLHSETIATYSLCGFTNFSSLAMTTAAMVALAPGRRSDINEVGLRSLIAGSVSCFVTACVAGMLYIPDLQCPHFLTTVLSNVNVTTSTQLLTCCTQLYTSVTVHEPWNVTTEGGFSLASLRGCCPFTAPTHFNCSSVL